MQAKRILALTLLAVALLGVFFVMANGGGTPVQAVGEPANTTMTRIQTYTLYPATALTGSQTKYSSAPYLDAYSRDASATNKFSAVDLFLTIDISGTGGVTMTAQVSADQSNWTDADFTWPDPVVTNTLRTTSYVRTLTADGTEYVRVPLAGEYLRVKLVTSGTVTPTVKATYRN